MKHKILLPFFIALALVGCSDSDSSSASEESSSSFEELSSASEFAPIEFSHVSATLGTSQVTFAGEVSIDIEAENVADALDSKIDSLQIVVKQNGSAVQTQTLYLEGVLGVALNSVSVSIESLESCGDFIAYVWAYASGSEGTPYSAVEEVPFNVPDAFCVDDEPASSSSVKQVISNCTAMTEGSISLSTANSGAGNYANLENETVSKERDDMQLRLNASGEYPTLEVVSASAEIGEADVSYKAGVIPEKVCLEEISMFEDTRSTSVELMANVWLTFEDGSYTYLILVGKISDVDGGSSVDLTYWKL